MRLSTTKYRGKGTTIAELPIGLWIIFVGIGLPLVVLVALTFRFALFWEAAREAAQSACGCQTFFSNPIFPANTQSAINAATAAANTVASTFNGFSLSSTNLYILTTNAGSTTDIVNTFGPYSVGSTSPGFVIDPDHNVYQVRVVVSGQIQPLLTVPAGILCFNSGNGISIPGLTAPIAVSASQERVFENPSGLNY